MVLKGEVHFKIQSIFIPANTLCFLAQCPQKQLSLQKCHLVFLIPFLWLDLSSGLGLCYLSPICFTASSLNFPLAVASVRLLASLPNGWVANQYFWLQCVPQAALLFVSCRKGDPSWTKGHSEKILMFSFCLLISRFVLSLNGMVYFLFHLSLQLFSLFRLLTMTLG